MRNTFSSFKETSQSLAHLPLAALHRDWKQPRVHFSLIRMDWLFLPLLKTAQTSDNEPWLQNDRFEPQHTTTEVDSSMPAIKGKAKGIPSPGEQGWGTELQWSSGLMSRGWGGPGVAGQGSKALLVHTGPSYFYLIAAKRKHGHTQATFM